jgi:LTXXQ motif family protein
MKRAVIAALAALGVGAFAIPLTAVSAQSDQQSSHADRAGQWAADREAMLDAKLSGMKAGLQLTPDQEKLWAPFESAVKDADQARMDAMGQMMQARRLGERMSPIDHLEAMADRLSRGAADVRKIADAAKPLYASLDDSQKHSFGMLGRMLVPERTEAAEMTHRHMGEGERDGDE